MTMELPEQDGYYWVAFKHDPKDWFICERYTSYTRTATNSLPAEETVRVRAHWLTTRYAACYENEEFARLVHGIGARVTCDRVHA